MSLYTLLVNGVKFHGSHWTRCCRKNGFSITRGYLALLIPLKSKMKSKWHFKNWFRVWSTMYCRPKTAYRQGNSLTALAICYWPFVRGIHRSPVNSLHKGQWRGALMFSLICTRINGWVNNREAGDLIRHRAHYDVIVMWNGLATLQATSKHINSLWWLL